MAIPPCGRMESATGTPPSPWRSLLRHQSELDHDEVLGQFDTAYRRVEASGRYVRSLGADPGLAAIQLTAPYEKDLVQPWADAPRTSTSRVQ